MAHHHASLHLNQNGHLPGAPPPVLGSNHDDQLPMLHENVNSDTKGPGNGVVLSAKSRIIYICNGGTGNGRLRAVVAEPHRGLNGTTQVPEQAALLLEDAGQVQDLQQNSQDFPQEGQLDNKPHHHGSDLSVLYEPSFESISRSQTGSPSGTTDNSPSTGRACSQCSDNLYEVTAASGNTQCSTSDNYVVGVHSTEPHNGTVLHNNKQRNQYNGEDSDMEDQDTKRNKSLSSDELLCKMLLSTSSSVDSGDDTPSKCMKNTSVDTAEFSKISSQGDLRSQRKINL